MGHKHYAKAKMALLQHEKYYAIIQLGTALYSLYYNTYIVICVNRIGK